jgi:hypothetical protein
MNQMGSAKTMQMPEFGRLLLGLSLSVVLTSAAALDNDAGSDRQTKTPYAARQDWRTLEQAPAGYRPVFTQLLARHGSRGLTGMKGDLVWYRLWQQAQQEDGLTPLGRELGPMILDLMRANFLLGYGVPGISKPGYGNETITGMAEQAGLAMRLQQRLPALFESIAPAGGKPQRQIVVVTSGKDRAVDSGAAFVQALVAQQPAWRAALYYPSASAGSNMPAGTNLFQLYFHRLPKTAPDDPQLLPTWHQSQAYRAYLHSAALREKLAEVQRDPQLQVAAQTVLQRLLKPAFLARLAQGKYRFDNGGTMSFRSADGKFINTVHGDGNSSISTPLEAARVLYELYAISAGMQHETSADFTRFMPAAAASVFAQEADAEDFYSKGSGMQEQNGVTYRMAGLLLEDFFQEADAIANGAREHAAKLRFAHAETIIPLAALMGLKNAAQANPQALHYNYQNNPWRGAEIAPMAANIQWDMYVDQAGHSLVRLLYNEADSDFKTACDSARISPQSHFYDYRKLRVCYAASP